MANIIVGIHGLANKPERSVLTDWWERSLREGLAKNCGMQNADFSFSLVYWADLLYKHHQHDDNDFDFDSLYSDQPYLPAQPGALKKYKDGWLDDARARVFGAGGAMIDAVKGIAGVGALTGWALDKMVRDLSFYYDENRQIRDRQGQRRQARQVLTDELRDTLLPLGGQRLMVIAHSMGSIIAYDVLRDIGRQNSAFAVSHFVTIGSPLGLSLVKDKVYQERSTYARVPVRTPTIVTEGWLNYADRKDPVTLDIHLRDDYDPNDRGVQVVDDLVLNDYVSPKGEGSSHKSYGYLRTPELSESVRDFLR